MTHITIRIAATTAMIATRATKMIGSTIVNGFVEACGGMGTMDTIGEVVTVTSTDVSVMVDVGSSKLKRESEREETTNHR